MPDGTFLGYMKSMGIFIICAQSFMYFTAGKTYEKYVKLLIGVMILAQFIVPVRAVFLGGDNAPVWADIRRFQRELETAMQEAGTGIGGGMETGGANGTGAGAETEKKALEAEIKERLANAAVSYGMSVEEVELVEDASKIAVVVRRKGDGRQENAKTENTKTENAKTEGGQMESGTIKVEKITVGQKTGQDIEWEKEDGETGGAVTEHAEDVSEGMAEAFAKVLGIDAGYMEITIRKQEK